MYIFEIDYLSVVSFAIIFSHSEGCLFTLLIVSFVVQKLFLEKVMAPHSSTLARKIPWMEEPGGLLSMGSLRVRHD